MGLLLQGGAEIAQFAADAAVVGVAVEVVQHQDRRLPLGQGGQAVEGGQGIARGFALMTGEAPEARDEIPAG